MKCVLITGAKGFVGRHLASHLSEHGYHVAGLGHGAWPEQESAKWGVSYWLNGEISSANLDRIATDVGLPDCIFHLAGGSAVGESLRVPAEDFQRTVVSSSHLLEWVRGSSISSRLVLASTAAVYGAGHAKPICEKEAISPYSPYGYHKRMAELLFESYSNNFGLMTSIVRLFSVYGTDLRKQLLWDLCNRLTAHPATLEMAGTGNECRDWLHVKDAVSYLVSAAELANSECFAVNGGTGAAVSVKQVVEFVRQLWPTQIRLQFTGKSRAGDPQFLVANTDWAYANGLKPSIGWQQGVAEYVKWFCTNVK